jgi:hypothetical protein
MDDEKVKMMIDLRIQNYFDHYLEKTLPKILDTHTQTCPHGHRISRVKWSLVGGAIVLTVLASPVLGKALLTLVFKI